MVCLRHRKITQREKRDEIRKESRSQDVSLGAWSVSDKEQWEDSAGFKPRRGLLCFRLQ